MIRFASFVFTLGILVPAASAVTYPLPPEGSRLVGAPITITVPEGNTLPLEAFAAQHGQGLSNMLEANPGVDPFLPRAGTQLAVPQLIRKDGDKHQVIDAENNLQHHQREQSYPD